MNSYNKNYNNGFIRLYIGPMFSGKTTALLEDYKRFGIAKKKCLLVKHTIDDRNDKNIITHSNIKYDVGIECEYLITLDSEVHNYDVICIDEIQFFPDGDVYCDKWANEGLIVICAGLSGDFNKRPFEVVSKLISKAEEIIKKSAVCQYSGYDASYSYKTCNRQQIIDIGASDKYTATDRNTYLRLLKEENQYEYNKQLIISIINNFNNVYKINVQYNDDTIKKYLNTDNDNKFLSDNIIKFFGNDEYYNILIKNKCKNYNNCEIINNCNKSMNNNLKNKNNNDY